MNYEIASIKKNQIKKKRYHLTIKKNEKSK